MYTTSKLIIEDCTRLSFHELQYEYPGIENDIKRSGLQGHNFWKDVQDFKWIKKEQSPNFRLIFDGKEQAPEEELQPVFHNPTHAVPAQVLKHEEPVKPISQAKPQHSEEPRTIINSDKFELPKHNPQFEYQQAEVLKKETEKPKQVQAPVKEEVKKPETQDEDDEIDEL